MNFVNSFGVQLKIYQSENSKICSESAVYMYWMEIVDLEFCIMHPKNVKLSLFISIIEISTLIYIH